MADLKISALTASTTPLAGTEVLPIVQSSTTKQVSVANLTAGRAVSMLSLTADTSTLVVDSTNHRVGVGTASPGRLLELYAAGSPNLRWNDSTNSWDIRTNGSVGSAMQFDYNGTRFFTLLSGGDATVNTGNLVISTAGKGIDFSATSHPAGMTSELLADYEEGTWTPTQGTGLTVVGTFSSSGSYTKVGRMVTVRGRVSGSTSVSIVANSQLCAGLPFTGTTGVEAEEGALTDNNITQVGVAQIYGATVYSTAITATTRMNFTISYFV